MPTYKHRKRISVSRNCNEKTDILHIVIHFIYPSLTHTHQNSRKWDRTRHFQLSHLSRDQDSLYFPVVELLFPVILLHENRHEWNCRCLFLLLAAIWHFIKKVQNYSQFRLFSNIYQCYIVKKNHKLIHYGLKCVKKERFCH